MIKGSLRFFKGDAMLVAIEPYTLCGTCQLSTPRAAWSEQCDRFRTETLA